MYIFMRGSDNCFARFLYALFQAVCLQKTASLLISPFHIGRYSCAIFSSQWSALTPNCILLFPMLILVNVTSLVVVFWFIWFYIFPGFPLIRHLYHPLIVIYLLHIMARSLPQNFWISLLRHYLLIPWKKYFFSISFMWDLKSIWFFVEYYLTFFHPFCCIRNHWRRFFVVVGIFFFIIPITVNHFFVIVHSYNPIRIKYYVICFIFYLIPCSMSSRVASACTCLIILGVIRMLVHFLRFSDLLVCKCNNSWHPRSFSIGGR